MAKAVIRHVVSEDLEEIVFIMNEIILSTVAIYDYDTRDKKWIEDWYTEKKVNNYPVLCAVVNGKVVGFTTYGPFRYRQGYKYTVEHSVHIKETYRGQGIGRNLLLKIIEQAKNENYHSIIGGIDCSNKISIELHEKLGFAQVAKIPEVAFKFDKWLDLCLLQKRL